LFFGEYLLAINLKVKHCPAIMPFEVALRS
jgi:hypothetical protein